MPSEPERPPLLDPDRPLVRWGVRAWLFVGLAVAFGILWHVAGLLHVVLYPLLLAVFPAAVVLPVARWLSAHGLPPAAAALAVTAALVAALVGVGTLVTLQVKAEISGIGDQLDAALDDLREQVPALAGLDPRQLLGGGGEEGAADRGGTGSDEEAPAVPDGAGAAAAAAVEGSLTFLAELALGIVAVFFYVKDGDRIVAWLRSLFPRSRSEDVRLVGASVWSSVAGYIRGQALIALVDAVLIGIGLLVVGTPLAMTLTVLVFLGAFVPVAGAIVAGSLAVGVALLTQGLGSALIVLAIIVGVQQLEGNVLAPVVLGRELDLHPLAVLAAITAGAVLLGVFGAIIAVPLAASIVKAVTVLRRREEPASTSAEGAV